MSFGTLAAQIYQQQQQQASAPTAVSSQLTGNSATSTAPTAAVSQQTSTAPNGVPAPAPGTSVSGFLPTGSAAASAGPAAPANGQMSSDPAYIQQVLQSWASAPGADPILKTPGGIQYYTDAIVRNGGLGSSNLGYWQNKSTLASYGGAVGAPEGGGNAAGSGGFGSLNFNPGPAFTPTPFTYNTPAFTPTQFTPTAFTAPTAADAANSPGEQFSLQQGIKAQQNSAFGKGLGLTGETAKALENYVNNTTQTDYGNVFNQALATNQNANNTGLAATTANNASGLAANQNAYTQAYGSNALNNQLGLAANQNQYQQALGTNQTNFGNLFNLTSLGENAAAQTGYLGQQNANSASQLITGGGNAAAAGTIGSANGITGGLQSGLSNLLLLSQLQNGSGYH